MLSHSPTIFVIVGDDTRRVTVPRFGLVWPRQTRSNFVFVESRQSPVLSSPQCFRPPRSFFYFFQLPTAALPMATAEVQEIRATSYVGFDSITQQIEHKLLKRGFQFNVIVVGASRGLFLVSQTCCNPRRRKNFTKRGSGHQVKPVWESRPSSTPYLLHTLSTRRAGVRLMSLCVRLRKFRRSLMVRTFLCYFSSGFVTLCVASLTRLARLSYHGERGATAS